MHRLETVCSGSACSLQDDRYEFDAKGNLVRRQRDLASPAGTREHFYIEHFRYDAADRLVLGWNEQYQSTVYGEEPPAVNVHRAPPANLSFYAEYDALGNLCRKTSWSTVNSWVAYHYQGASGCGLDGRGGSGSNNTGAGHKLSALEVDEGRSRLWVELDANGNHVRGGDGSEAGSKVYRYTGRNQVASVYEGSELAPRVRVRFAYGADGARYLRIDDGIGQAERRTTYVGGVERIEEDGAVTWRRPVAGVVLQEIQDEAVSGGITVAGSRTSSHQLYFDHLGSVVLWVDLGAGGGGPPGTGSLFADSFEDGPLPKAALGVSVVKRFDYGPHGEPRPLGMARLAAGVAATEVPWRGFTGHEHIDALSTIHMGGRIYDPLLGRFLQPDPIVQSPWEGQNWNPYAYVLNNPLSFTDPSGLITLKDAWRTVVGIVVAVYAPQFFATYMKMSGFWSTVAAGFSSGVVTSGSLKGGVYGAFSAGAFYGVGSANWPQAAPGEGALGTSLTAGALAGKTALHGLVGGVMASLQGGKFGHGFVSAGITQLSSGAIDRIDEANPGISAGRVTVAALVGGTTSVLTGGKFANGAVTAAFSRAFNDEAHGDTGPQRDEEGYLIGGYSPAAGSYATVDGRVLDLQVSSFNFLFDAKGHGYAFDPSSGRVIPLDSQAIESVCPEAYIGVVGAWRLVVGSGYRAIAWATARGTATYETFAMGSVARTAWKAVNLSPRWVRPSRLFVHPRYYWARANGNFSAAVRSLGQPNTGWDRALIPTAPLATGLFTD